MTLAPFPPFPPLEYSFVWDIDFETGLVTTTKTDLVDKNWDTIVTVYDVSEYEGPIPFPIPVLTAEEIGEKPSSPELEIEPVAPFDFDLLEIVSITTTLDNGIVKIEDYDDGVIDQLTCIDVEDVKNNWYVKVEQYNEDGEVSLFARVTDEFVVHVNTYGYEDGGERFTTSKNSFDLSTDGTAKSWTSISCEFDLDGELVTKTTIYDDGREKVVAFSDEGKVVSWTDGSPDEYEWATKEITFDDEGNRVSSVVVQDDSDVIATLYDNGTKLLRLDIDLSETHDDWFAREVIYDCDGNVVEVILFETAEDIAENFVLPEGCEELVLA